MHDTHWKKGPLPKDTWNWGGVVTKDMDPGAQGFLLAGFNGEHAVDAVKGTRIEAADIVMYNNCLTVPPTSF